ncbi:MULTISPECIES: branched-chain amino acid ABC transporter permease [unclassified Variovorax]|jgi:branched-chain amino acid transport system permease protein|uniref:branched-chain amino acid ABC transporter permease n=1 Tax=unclassified Variovorax TaxID=663243 RepID=UPI000A406111|nr:MULTISPECIES: branched-chain amino acid ABC transporter permease [unclassified Variovorax]MBN8756648.1 branched-chain amino acid ABC transporter permease [Variovorax sp.]
MAVVPGVSGLSAVAPRAATSPRPSSAEGTARARGAGLLKPGIVVVVLIVLGLFVPSVLKSTFYLGLLVNAITLGIAALAIGFLAHQSGLMMFGAAAFTGSATYLFAIAVTQFGWNAMTAAAFTLVGATLLSALIGALVVRARPLPFAMLTLALAQMLRSLVMVTDFRPITGGDDGLALNFSGTFFGLTQAQLSTPEGFWPVAWLALCGVMLLAWAAGRSRTGSVLRAIRSNEERMRFSGFNTYLPRVLAFTLSGFIAAVSGLLTGLYTAFASPELLDFATGGNALVSTLVGGISTVAGPVLGALLYVVGQDQFGATGHLELLTGLGVVLVIVAFPEGIMGFIRNGIARLFKRGAHAVPNAPVKKGADHAAR